MKTIASVVIGMSLALLGTQVAHARGFGGGGGHGGGYRGGGFGGGGGYRSGGFGGGGEFHGGEFHGGEFGGGGAYHGGEFGGEGYRGGFNAGGYHTEGFNAAGVHANPYAGHVGLPTDGAFGRSWAGGAGYAGFAHGTSAWSGSVAAARGVSVRNNFNHYGYYHHGWFGPGWYHGHPGAWFAAGWAAGAAWNWAAWPAIDAWCGWGAAEPIVYEYGNNVTYQDNEVYYGDQPIATADEYYQQAATLAQSVPPPPAPAPQSADWMPLGVFSLVQGNQTDSSTLFQLALSKSGAIAGNYYSVLTGATLPVHGAVDQKTQRVAWTVGDNTTTVYDAGISSLTNDEAPLLVHFGKDQTQQWMLVRMKQPPEQPAQQ